MHLLQGYARYTTNGKIKDEGYAVRLNNTFSKKIKFVSLLNVIVSELSVYESTLSVN